MYFKLLREWRMKKIAFYMCQFLIGNVFHIMVETVRKANEVVCVNSS